MKRSLFYCFVILLLSCTNQNSSTGVVIELFDTAKYIDQLYPADTYEAHVVKTVAYDGDRQRLEDRQYDLSKDLEIIKEVNINNPNWTDRYSLDTLQKTDQDYQLLYTAIDEKLKIRSMTTTHVAGEIVGFEAVQERNALIANATKRIRFDKGQGYSIMTSSENLISDRRDIHIEVAFQNE